MTFTHNLECATKSHWRTPGLAALFALLNVACGASAQPNHARQHEQGQAQPTIYFVRNPDPAPEFQLSGLDGKPISLAAARGKIILLNFWASWCGPCRAEVSDLVELQERYKDRLQVIGLIVDDDDMDAIHQFVKDFGINYPVGVAPVELRVQYGGIPALPTSFVLDTQGRVVQKHVGLRDPALYETEIRALLGLPTGFKVETFEDTGEIFLKNANRASELPGVDFSKLTAEQKKVALHRFNAESCNCGCTLTLAQCRINDSACQVSKALTAKIIGELTGTHGSSQPAKSTPAAPAQPNAPASPALPARPNVGP
jgi:thiol-disulfide isomerase/thioredoxin